MITIVAKNIVKDGKAELYKAIARELIEESRKEDGCISYDLHQDINNKNVLTFIEQWRDKDAIALHNKSAHYNKVVPKLGELREDSEINLYATI